MACADPHKNTAVYSPEDPSFLMDQVSLEDLEDPGDRKSKQFRLKFSTRTVPQV